MSCELETVMLNFALQKYPQNERLKQTIRIFNTWAHGAWDAMILKTQDGKV